MLEISPRCLDRCLIVSPQKRGAPFYKKKIQNVHHQRRYDLNLNPTDIIKGNSDILFDHTKGMSFENIKENGFYIGTPTTGQHTNPKNHNDIHNIYSNNNICEYRKCTSNAQNSIRYTDQHKLHYVAMRQLNYNPTREH
ncbi:hypothetical protein PFDG_04932 [Plasmodium falciparum Dd2]|uniref:Uncharacterized protein n=1 Tax=Plasmodium falciparum (isolate Dd2) TaxID=57267 RepID=A0A0L7M9B0_PLAF4|nr:hypothetical protein PFDG_04932 [Plasmodium falciparum Dd2]